MKTFIENLIKKTCHAELDSASQVAPSSDTSCHLLPPMGRRQFSFAFTLAEVLITLGIIGVVAALTIPSLVANYQKKRVAITLKKSYAELNQALQMGVAENGPNWNYTRADNISLWVQDYIEPYIKFNKAVNCPSNNTSPCSGIQRVRLLGNPKSEPAKTGGYVLQNPGSATAWWFYWYQGGEYVNVKVYVNNPNIPILGKDVFTFTLMDKNKPRFLPFGADGTIPYSGKVTRNNLLKGPIRTGGCYKESGGPDYYGPGDSCAAVIMMDGWEIKDDYPW